MEFGLCETVFIERFTAFVFSNWITVHSDVMNLLVKSMNSQLYFELAILQNYGQILYI